MMHPQANAISVKVVNSRHLIAKIVVGGITRHFPHLGHNVQLVSGDVLDPHVDPPIPFASVTVVLMSDMLFEEFVHQQIVHLLLSRCGRLRWLVKTKALPRHLHGLFSSPRTVTLNVRWCASGCTYLVYDKIFEVGSDSVN